MNEQVEGYREKLREARDERSLQDDLNKNSLFLRYRTFLEAQIQHRRRAYEGLEPKGIDGLVENEFMRGELAGLNIAILYLTKNEANIDEAIALLSEAIADAQTKESEK